MKTYLKTINLTQNLMLGIGIGILALLPSIIVLAPNSYDRDALYAMAQLALFLVMIVRPLADLLPRVRWIRPLVILRKGFGVFSASIVVAFMIAKLIVDPVAFFGAYTTIKYWSFTNLALFAHLSDISAVLLLITSNKLSKRLLGKNWKRIQRSSYVYFYGSTLYITFILGERTPIFYLLVVTGLTYFAFVKNRDRRLRAAAEKHTPLTPTRPMSTIRPNPTEQPIRMR